MRCIELMTQEVIPALKEHTSRSKTARAAGWQAYGILRPAGAASS